MSVVAHHDGTSDSWSDLPGIEFWSIKVLLSGTAPESLAEQDAVVAVADIWRIDNTLCLDQVFLLDCISYDLGVIGQAVASSQNVLTDLSIAEGMNSSYAIADLVLVDKYWRGLEGRTARSWCQREGSARAR